MRLDTSGPNLSQRYRLIRVLKRGQGIETRLAVDRQTGAEVVIKTTDAAMLSAEARMRLEHEGAILRRLQSPSLRPVLDMGYESDLLYVVMPFVAGVTLQERLAAGPLDLADALTVARSLLCALAEVHSHGVLHRDVKPANVIVDSTSPLQRVTLVDFGLASSASLLLALRDQPAGTARYMAPEQAGLLDRPLEERADLYSAGIVLFECLAGRPPFDAERMSEVLRQQLSTPAPALRSLGIQVPRALEEIVQRLLRKDPDDRYQSARAALADIDALIGALERGVAEPEIVVGAHDWRRTLAEPPLIGREAELAALERHLQDAWHGSGGLVILEAASGGGKTRVLDEFTQRAAGSGAWVLRGQGLERAALRPLQVLAGVIADLVAATRSSPGLAVQLRERIGEARQSLGDVLPELRDTLEVTGLRAPGPEAYAQARSVTALVTLLDALGSAERPAVVVLDDCQWADEFTLHVLAAWAERLSASDAPPCHVLLVASVRPEELDDRHPLRTLRRSRLVLPPLEPDEVGQVIESMAGSVPAEAAAVVVELSRGNPFMASAVLRGLVEAGVLSSGRLGWRFEPEASGWQASREAAAFLARRLELLAPATRRLLSAGAVLGRQFDLHLAGVLTEQDETEANRAAAQAVERYLVWFRDGQRCTFVHDRLREALLGALEPGELAELHRRAAEEMEAADPTRDFELAYHFDAAGEPERALGYALQSGEAARARHDVELAERQYRIAERGMGRADHETRQAVAEALGQILMLRGRYEEAGQRLELARSLAQDELSLARIEGEFSELLFKRDDLEGAAERIEAALKVLGETVPRGWPSLVVLLCRDVLLRVMPRRIRMRRRPSAVSDAAAERRRLAAHLFTRLQYPWWFHRRRMATLWLMMRQVNVAERRPGSPELAHAYGVWGAALTLTFPFLWRRGRQYVERSAAFYEQQGDLWGKGHAASMLTCVLHAAGLYLEAVEAGGRAIQLLEQSGDPWELNFAARNRALCLYRLGSLREAVEEARRLHRAGVDVGDAQAETTALEIWAKAAGGQLPSERTLTALRHVGADLEVTVAALQAEALRLRAAGYLGDALLTLEKAAKVIRRAWPSNTYLAPVHPWLATLYREAAEQPLLPGPRRRLLRKARRATGRALRYAALYRNDLPHALREAAMVAALSGRLRRARRFFDRSLEVANRQQAPAEHAETLRQRERLGMAGGPSAQGDRLDREQILEAAGTVPRQPTLGLAGRFDALLEAGGRLALAASADEIAAAVRDAAVTLLRAEQCAVVGIGSRESGPGEQGSERRPVWGRALAQRAAERRRPVVLTQALAAGEDASDSLVLAGVRSALCAPIIVREEMAGYFLASHLRVGSLFGEEEERLAQFIAHLAGAALERELLQQEMRGSIIAAREGERARVARDLHDEIGQALTSVLLGVRLLESSSQGPQPDLGAVASRTQELRQLVGEAITSVQRLAFELRPQVLDDLGLVAAVRRLAGDEAFAQGVAVTLEAVELAPGDRLPADVETTAYRVIQEALTNVARHSKASMCSVVIARVEKRLRVVVEDDGAGFDAAAHLERGLGLRGMSERAALVGGALRIESSPGQGTTVVFEVPIG